MTLMSIEDEIAHLITFLSHPAGFDVGVSGTLQIRPMDEGSPPTNWAVDWEEEDENILFEYERCFSSLSEAAQFFVEKRRYMCNGMDFEKIYLTDVGEITIAVEIITDE
jgi:hypothetical protein